MGKKAKAREAAALQHEAELAAAAARALESMREAGAEADAEPLSKAERKALKAQRKAQAAGLAANTGTTVPEATEALIDAQAVAPAVGPAVVTGAVVTSSPIPDVEQVVAAQAVKVKGKGKGKRKASDPAPTPAPEQPGTTPQPSDPGVVVGQASELVAPAEPEGVEPVERDQWGRPKVLMPDGTMRGYRRVTTFIDVLEDKSSLGKWGERVTLEGALLDYRDTSHAVERPSLINRVGLALDARDNALNALDTATASELLSLGGTPEQVHKRFKDAMDALVEEAKGRAGAHDKATKGTDLHALTELVDQGLPLPDDISDLDRRDLEAYRQAIKAAGIVFTERERFVVLDDLGVGGTLDRAGLFKFRGTSRARRCVMDIKTGRVDYSPGKIAMQLATYAHGLAYDRDTRERTDLKLDKSKALLIHLPAGTGRCDIIEVDIAAAWSKAVRLANEVYAWRTEGKRVFDVKAPVVHIDLGAAAAAA